MIAMAAMLTSVSDKYTKHHELPSTATLGSRCDCAFNGAEHQIQHQDSEEDRSELVFEFRPIVMREHMSDGNRCDNRDLRSRLIAHRKQEACDDHGSHEILLKDQSQ
jgi:hypothetical protein